MLPARHTLQCFFTHTQALYLSFSLSLSASHSLYPPPLSLSLSLSLSYKYTTVMFTLCRCVSAKDKGLAVGFSAFMTSMLGEFRRAIQYDIPLEITFKINIPNSDAKSFLERFPNCTDCSRSALKRYFNSFPISSWCILLMAHNFYLKSYCFIFLERFAIKF